MEGECERSVGISVPEAGPFVLIDNHVGGALQGGREGGREGGRVRTSRTYSRFDDHVGGALEGEGGREGREESKMNDRYERKFAAFFLLLLLLFFT